MPFKILKSRNKFREVEFWQEPILNNKIFDWHTKDTKNTTGQWNTYELNPLMLIMNEMKWELYRTYMQEHFEWLNLILNGKMDRVWDLSNKEIMAHMDNSEYDLVTSKWFKVDKNSVKNWKAEVSIWDEKEVVELNVEDLYFRTHKGWIKKYLWQQWIKEMDDYMDTIAHGGQYGRTKDARILAKIANNLNIMPLIGNPSVILKQWLSLWDAMWVLWARQTLEWLSELAREPQLFTFLNKNVQSIRTRWADIIQKENINYSPYKHSIPWKALSLFSSYKEIGTIPLKEFDKYIYSTIWYTSYKNILKKQGKKMDLNNLDVKAVALADNKAEMIAWWANPLMQPNIYKSVLAKVFFWIFSTQLNRVQKVIHHTPILLKEWEQLRAIKMITMFAAMNIADMYISYQVGKLLFNLWLATYNPEQDFQNILLSNKWIYNITLGQTFAWSKLSNLQWGWNIAPLLSWFDKTRKGIEETFNWNLEWLQKVIVSNFWWKFEWMVYTWVKSLFVK